MIRVGLISHLSEVSGAGIALLRIGRALDPERFWTVVVLPGRGPLYELAQKQKVRCEVIENPEEGMADASLRKRIQLGVQRLRYIKALMRFFRSADIDIVYVNTTITVFAGIAARLAGKPIVWHVRELLESPTLGTRMKMWLIEHLSDAIFYASHAGMKCFPAPRVPHRLVVRNIVDVEKFLHAKASDSVVKELGIAPHEIVITSNGVFPRKAPDIFLRAAAEVVSKTNKAVRFLLVGPPLPEHLEYYEEMKKLASTLGIEKQVTFTGLRMDMPEILARTDIFVSPSRNEAQPNIINEALVSGTPVIASDVGDCRLMLRNGAFGELVPPDNPSALAQAILDMLENMEEARAKARMAQRALVEEFSSPEFWKPVEDTLETLARKRKH